MLEAIVGCAGGIQWSGTLMPMVRASESLGFGLEGVCAGRSHLTVSMVPTAGNDGIHRNISLS